MLIESCALYALSIGPRASWSPVANIFFPILTETQVRALLFSLTHRILGHCCLITVIDRHCPVPHHSTSPQPEIIDGELSRSRACQLT